MKVHFILCLLVITLLLSGCGQASVSDNIESGENPQFNVEILDLGVSSFADESLDLNARNIWDIATIDNELYTACGDFDKNSGATSIWKYDLNSSKWVDSGRVEQEAVIRFLNLNGDIIAIGADPVDRPESAEVYILKENRWEVFAQIKNALHIFDSEYFNNAVYFGVGYETSDYPIVKYLPQTDEYTNIPLIKNGTDVILALEQNSNVKYKRVYDLFSLNGNLYCAFSCAYVDGKTTVEFFKLSDGKFEFCQALKASGMVMNKSVKNQMLFNSDAIFGGNCYLSLGNLYRTDDFKNFNKIDIPNDACVTDLLVDNDGETEVLYILAVSKTNKNYSNTVYKFDSQKISEVYSFTNECSALSFTKNDKNFYIAMGGEGISSINTGRVYEVEFE